MTALPQVGRYHAVTPGPDGPEPAFFDPDLAGMKAAMRAAMAPRDGVPRAVTAVAGRVVTDLCTITDGAAEWPEGSAVIPARKTPRKGKTS
jgi:hypothetical protein